MRGTVEDCTVRAVRDVSHMLFMFLMLFTENIVKMMSSPGG